MKKKWSKTWNKSKQPRKQRKFRLNAPLHVKDKFMHSNLSKELRKKHGIRSIRIRKEDKVIVTRGQLKGHVGKVDRINTKSYRVYITKAEISKKDGSKAQIPINCSNIMIQELSEDRKRFKRTQTKKEEKKTELKKEQKKLEPKQENKEKESNVIKNDKKTS